MDIKTLVKGRKVHVRAYDEELTKLGLADKTAFEALIGKLGASVMAAPSSRMAVCVYGPAALGSEWLASSQSKYTGAQFVQVDDLQHASSLPASVLDGIVGKKRGRRAFAEHVPITVTHDDGEEDDDDDDDDEDAAGGGNVRRRVRGAAAAPAAKRRASAAAGAMISGSNGAVGTDGAVGTAVPTTSLSQAAVAAASAAYAAAIAVSSYASSSSSGGGASSGASGYGASRSGVGSRSRTSSTSPGAVGGAGASRFAALESLCGGMTAERLAYAGGTFPLPPAGAVRSVPWCGTAPRSIKDRISRAMAQRLMLIDRRRAVDRGTAKPSRASAGAGAGAWAGAAAASSSAGGAGGGDGADAGPVAYDFDVTGSTGNVYCVHIGTQPHCTCPDYPRSLDCKHVLFVLMKVLGVPRQHPLLWQAAYLPNELEYMFQHAPAPGTAATRAVLAPQEVRLATAAATGRTLELAVDAAGGEAGAGAAKAEVKPHSPEELCAVCFDVLGETADVLTSCAACNNYLHDACFTAWKKARATAGQPVTCPFCRATWRSNKPSGPTATTAAPSKEGGYLNVAALMPGAGLADPHTEALRYLYSYGYRRGGGGGGGGGYGDY